MRRNEKITFDKIYIFQEIMKLTKKKKKEKKNKKE